MVLGVVDFIVYHYRVAYRLYLEKMIMEQGFISYEIVWSEFRTNLLL